MAPDSQMPTNIVTPSVAAAAKRRPPPPVVGRLASSDSIDGGGFTPGAVIAERYRVIGLIGRGGMGEVYRADDLKLGQPVALKFLPRELSKDKNRLERFYAEVRTARQVSHPNVCRVYDIAEVDGHHFLSMEYIDGEDLASLLRRIGRLPPDKAIDVARQLCAGLAAAHDRGVLHRDLKPANVMLDGRGRARITDFGLAAVAGEAHSADELAGTPAYMAPEQFAGKGASVHSDLYALGLVLYELYTGKRAVDAVTLAGYRKKHLEETPTAPSAVVKDMDPAVERVILRCMEKDPRQRPASAAQVALALPGGDPLAAALAAGETPSPEMVAAAGEPGTMRPAAAWTSLLVILLGLPVAVFLSPLISLHGKVPLEKPTEALVERAKEVVRRLGYAERPADHSSGLMENKEYLRWVETHDQSAGRWADMADGRPAGIIFAYRQSPWALIPQDFFTGAPFNGIVTMEDPPPTLAGMTSVRLDPLGRLIGFERIPPAAESEPAPAAVAPDWSLLFKESGLDPARFTPVASTWIPAVYADARAAWTETVPEVGRSPWRVEAAAYRGKPVSFELIGPWSRPSRTPPSGPRRGEAAEALLVGLFLLALLGGAILARRNVRLQRGDRHGAFRVALFVFSALLFGWAVGADHLPGGGEVGLFLMMVSWALFIAATVWMLYIALEPFVRRRWPETLISWSRLLAGRWRDPRIGRDLLVGGAVGIGGSLLTQLALLLESRTGTPPRPREVFLFPLQGAHIVAADVVLVLGISLFAAIGIFFLLFALRLLLRKEALAGAALTLLLTALSEAVGEGWPVLIAEAIGLAALTVVLIRLGLLAAAFSFFFAHYLRFPLTPDLSLWYAGYMLLPLLILAALAVYGFRLALAGRPAFVTLEQLEGY